MGTGIGYVVLMLSNVNERSSRWRHTFLSLGNTASGWECCMAVVLQAWPRLCETEMVCKYWCEWLPCYYLPEGLTEHIPISSLKRGTSVAMVTCSKCEPGVRKYSYGPLGLCIIFLCPFPPLALLQLCQTSDECIVIPKLFTLKFSDAKELYMQVSW